jgi:hypothetical protein
MMKRDKWTRVARDRYPLLEVVCGSGSFAVMHETRCYLFQTSQRAVDFKRSTSPGGRLVQLVQLVAEHPRKIAR